MMGVCVLLKGGDGLKAKMSWRVEDEEEQVGWLVVWYTFAELSEPLFPPSDPCNCQGALTGTRITWWQQQLWPTYMIQGRQLLPQRRKTDQDKGRGTPTSYFSLNIIMMMKNG